MAVVLGGALVLVLRLYQVQVVEHEVWANEAANLVRSGRIVPFERGRILDARGRTIVRDHELYRIDFSYREFRRGHPLGQVTHARATLEMRAVPLQEGCAHLVEWATELTRLSPHALGEWMRGGTLVTPSLMLPASESPGDENRRSRARDLGFYVGRLLSLSRSEQREMHRALNEWESKETFVELLARWRGRSGSHRDDRGDAEAAAEVLLGELRAGWQRSLGELGELARLLADGSSRRASATALDDLVRDLEECRRSVEDDTASRLFREAAGFGPGRVASEVLDAAVDLDWIARRLFWDEARTRAWLERARAAWLGWRDSWGVEEVAAEVAVRREREGAGPDDVLDAGVAFFRHPSDESTAWRELERLRVVAELGETFDGLSFERDEIGSLVVLPIQDPELRALQLRPEDRWHLLGYLGEDVAELTLASRARAVERGAAWRRALKNRLRRDEFDPLLIELFEDWERRLQRAARAALERLLAEQAAEGRGGKLRFTEERLERATERARFIRIDLESRERRIVREPDYEIVHLLSRYPERFAGFVVRDAHVRVFEALTSGDEPLAALLIGRVRQSDVRELREQREEAEELRSLLAIGTRTRSETERLSELVPRVFRPDQVRGAEGLEALCDPELSGHNGYEETRGLQEKGDTHQRWTVDPTDGEDVWLTLDLDVQRTARDALEHPRRDPDVAMRDEAWLAHPVGAIVLLSVTGDVVAAASVPNRPPANEPAERRPPEWQIVRERTLRKPTFQPPGSVFKPFVAAWALDYLQWDPLAENDCNAIPDGGSGYKDLRCWKRYGHGFVDLHGALEGSCNAYFAWMGEAFDSREFHACMREFGFGQPTGINDLFGDDAELGRGSLREASSSHILTRTLRGRDLRLAGNGLGVVEANPMQVARATCGLATGRLPDVRLVAALGDRLVPRRSRPLAISTGTLAAIRAALIAVTHERGGTASRAELVEDRLGFAVAAKTGSADLQGRSEEGRVRKHTWFAGWMPARDPRYVCVVFCHDTRVTSSHSAIWIAQDFLESPAVRELVLGGGG